jgi:hypothetical protein
MIDTAKITDIVKTISNEIEMINDTDEWVIGYDRKGGKIIIASGKDMAVKTKYEYIEEYGGMISRKIRASFTELKINMYHGKSGCIISIKKDGNDG